jgi:hypothetical protein
MNLCARVMAVMALLGTALIGLGQYRPAWAVQVDLDWWNLPELYEELRRGQQDLEAREAQRRAAVERLRVRAAIIEDLRAGRLTLVQAAAHFRRLNALATDCAIDLREHIAGKTEEERACRQVIYWADSAERPAPAVRGQTRRHLEAELDALLAENHGVLRLEE